MFNYPEVIFIHSYPGFSGRYSQIQIIPNILDALADVNVCRTIQDKWTETTKANLIRTINPNYFSITTNGNFSPSAQWHSRQMIFISLPPSQETPARPQLLGISRTRARLTITKGIHASRARITNTFLSLTTNTSTPHDHDLCPRHISFLNSRLHNVNSTMSVSGCSFDLSMSVDWARRIQNEIS